MATVTRSPTAAASLADGDASWSTPSNILASDDARAIVVLGAGLVSDTLRATDFGFALEIPAGSTINAITIHIERRDNLGSGDATDKTIQLWDGAAAIGDDMATATAWPAADAVADYVVTGTLPSAAVVRTSGFGVSILAQASESNGRPAVDHVTLEISFAPPARRMFMFYQRLRRGH